MHDSIFFLSYVLKNKVNIGKFDHLYTRRWKYFSIFPNYILRFTYLSFREVFPSLQSRNIIIQQVTVGFRLFFFPLVRCGIEKFLEISLKSRNREKTAFRCHLIHSIILFAHKLAGLLNPHKIQEIHRCHTNLFLKDTPEMRFAQPAAFCELCRLQRFSIMLLHQM